jgi:O-antigen ligase
MTTASNTAESTSSALERVFPASYCRTESKWIDWLSLVALILLPTTILISEDATRLAIYILLLTKFLSWKYVARSIQSTWLYWMALAFFVYMLLAVVYAVYNSTIPFSEHWHFTERCIFLFGFLLVGWWMGDSDRSLTTFIYLIFLGLVLGLIKYSSLADWTNMLELKRVTFGLHNSEHSALWFGSGLMLAVFQLSRRLQSKNQILLKTLIESALLVLFLMVFIATQTRAAWLGVIAGLILTTLLLKFFRHLDNRINSNRYIFGGSLLILSIIFISALFYFSDGFRSNMIRDVKQSTLFVKGDDNVKASSMTIRLFEWRYALILIEDRPLLGYGPATRSELLKKKEITDFIGVTFGHFHSSYLGLALGFGLAATAFFLLMLGSIYYLLVRKWFTRKINEKIFILGTVWIAYFVVINFFESYVYYRTGYSSASLYIGILYSSLSMKKTLKST